MSPRRIAPRHITPILLLMTALTAACPSTPPASDGPSSVSPIVLSLDASPAMIHAGESATLTWRSAQATEVTLSPDIGSVEPSGTRTVSPLTTTSYTLVASSATGSDIRSVTITVDGAVTPPDLGMAPPPDLTAPPVTVSELTITFYTLDDDKDDDTFLSVDIPGAAAWNQTDDERFPDQSTTSKTLDPSTVKLAQLSGNTLSLCIAPNGNDTWKFSYRLQGLRSDGAIYSVMETSLELSQDASKKCHTHVLP